MSCYIEVVKFRFWIRHLPLNWQDRKRVEAAAMQRMLAELKAAMTPKQWNAAKDSGSLL